MDDQTQTFYSHHFQWSNKKQTLSLEIISPIRPPHPQQTADFLLPLLARAQSILPNLPLVHLQDSDSKTLNATGTEDYIKVQVLLTANKLFVLCARDKIEKLTKKEENHYHPAVDGCWAGPRWSQQHSNLALLSSGLTLPSSRCSLLILCPAAANTSGHGHRARAGHHVLPPAWTGLPSASPL